MAPSPAAARGRRCVWFPFIEKGQLEYGAVAFIAVRESASEEDVVRSGPRSAVLLAARCRASCGTRRTEPAAGLERAHDANIFIWASLSYQRGTVFRIDG